MREDTWLAERLARPVLTFEAGDDPAEIARATAERAPAFAQAKIATADVATAVALQDAGFRVVDVSVTLSRRAGMADAPEDVCDAREADRNAVLEIAGRHYDVSRFHHDAAIPRSAANAIKRDWAAAYLDGQRGERLLVVRRDSRPIGFLAVLASSPGVRVIDLVVVHPDARGAGAGRALVEALLACGDGRVDVGTQIANTGALRFYERLGFIVCETRYVLHLHA